MFINLVNNGLEEIKGILLFSYIDSLTPEFEHTPELLRFMILQAAFHHVAKYLLHLVENTETNTKLNMIAMITMSIQSIEKLKNVLRGLKKHT